MENSVYTTVHSYTVRNKACLYNFIKFEVLVFIPQLNHLYSGRNGDLFFKDI